MRCGSSAIGDLHEMAHAVDHPARLGVVLDLDGVADAAQAERAQRVELALVGAVARLDLRDLHAVAFSSAPGSASAAASVSGFASGSASAAGSAGGASSSGSACRPRTALTDRPRSSATSSG